MCGTLGSWHEQAHHVVVCRIISVVELLLDEVDVVRVDALDAQLALRRLGQRRSSACWQS
jgi:hypothetical protein